ncbi:hypothetical protein RSO68_14725 [Halomonas saccharevitans]|uniref:Type I restriction enzyme, S subunit n=1 Tax=Halomonas saccharevitans TaxID=416872 RepID=A0ABU3NHS8_9GAMM|nr:hypothetical protein [Halomonas saccharevitans]MDT8880728.1 hypothetical protein [Halomonas saccharevitans]
MSFPAYPEYKDSGVEWLGEVPTHWDLARSDAYISSESESISADRLDGKEVFHYSIPVVQETGDGQFEDGDEIESSKLVVSRKQVLFSKLNPRKGTVCLACPRSTLTVCSGEFVPLFSRKISHEYLLYLVRTTNFRFRIESMVESATRSHQRASPSDIAKFRWAFPPKEEQATIAAFLDHETDRIDALVEEQQRLIALLKEKRQAVISHAVTKGLDPDVPMKDSGVEWLGEVPAHWEVLRLKRISPEITVGIVVEPSKYYVDDGVPALRSLNVRPGEISDEQMVYISPESNEVLAKSKLYEGDLVAVRSGQPGTTAVVPKGLDGCNCIDLIVIRKPTAGCEKFLCWFLASDCAVRQFSEGSGGAIQQHFNISTAANIIVSTPSEAEQKRIAEYLDRETSKIDELIATAESTSELLSERRSALISAAVTGKIDVRGWTPPANSAPTQQEARMEAV